LLSHVAAWDAPLSLSVACIESRTLGKYLNPDLYVVYSQGLFNPEGAVLMRLKLREKLAVETRSGNEQSVDLYYRIEHD
jgi:translocation and assembly module TamB